MWRGIRSKSTLLLVTLALAVLFAVSCSALGTRATVVSALVVTVVFLLAQRPAYGVAVVIALAPLEAVGRVSPDLPWLTYTRLALAGTVLAILAFRDLGDSMSRVPKGFGLLALYVLAGIIGSTLNVATSTSTIEIAAALLGLLLVWIVTVAVRSREDLLVLWWAVIAGAVAVVFVAMLDLVTGTSALGTVETQFPGSAELGLSRITATFYDPNAFGRYLVFAFLVTLGVFSVTSHWRKWLLLPLMGGQLFFLYTTFSRGAALSLAAAVVVLALWSSRATTRLVLAAAFTAFLAAVVTLGNRFVAWSGFLRPRGGDSFRIDIWVAGLKAFAERPIFGHGLGNVEAAIGRNLGSVRSSHNVYVEALAATGLVGATALFGYCGMWFVKMVKQRRSPGGTYVRTAATVLVAVLTMGLVLHGLRADEFWLALAFAPAAVAVSREEDSQNE